MNKTERVAIATTLLAAVLLAAPASRAMAESPVGQANRRVAINALATFSLYGRRVGTAEKVYVWYDTTSDEQMRIAFIEDVIDGYGEMWRGAAWQAAIVAADLCGRDLSGVRVFFDRSGRVDGPSAGAITTIGVLAALRGDTVRDDVAMTGTINPDGTIGPVGGIPHKISGAAEAGMKVVMVPYGTRNQKDMNTGEMIDLVEHGEDLGVEVRLVGDIYTAYKIATGTDLPRSPPAPSPQLSSSVYRRLRIKVDEWLVRYRDQVGEYNRSPDRFRSDYTDELIDEAKAYADSIPDLLNEGQASAAYSNAVDAAILATEAAEITRTLWVDGQRGRKEAIVFAQRFAQAKTKARVAAERLKGYRPKSLAQAGTLIYAYAAFSDGLCYQDLAEKTLSGKLKLPLGFETEDADEEEIEHILEAVSYMVLAAADYQLVGDTLDVAGELGGRAAPDNMPLDVTGDFFRRAAQANLYQFEQSILNTEAEGAGVSLAKVKFAAMVKDEDYLLARWGADNVYELLYNRFSGEPLAYAKLGHALRTYSIASTLMANYYSLRVKFDEDGMIVGIGREAPLRFMLNFAEEQARRNVRMLRDAGVDPSDVVYGYSCAGVYRNGELGDRLYALQVLWEANIVARTMAYLGGFADGAAPPEATAVSREAPTAPAG
ncbi:MAG: S16 family serine protease [Planctomycetota bacterium]